MLELSLRIIERRSAFVGGSIVRLLLRVGRVLLLFERRILLFELLDRVFELKFGRMLFYTNILIDLTYLTMLVDFCCRRGDIIPLKIELH